MILNDLVTKVYDEIEGTNRVFEDLDLVQHIDLLMTLQRAFAHDHFAIEDDRGKTVAIPYRDGGGIVRLAYLFRSQFLADFKHVPLHNLNALALPKERERLAVLMLPELKAAHERLLRPHFGEGALELLLAAEVPEPLAFSEVEVVKAFLYPFAHIPLSSDAFLVTTIFQEAIAEVELEKTLFSAHEFFIYTSSMGCASDAISAAKRLLLTSDAPIAIRSRFDHNHQEALRQMKYLANMGRKASVLESGKLDSLSTQELEELAENDILFLLNFSPLALNDDAEAHLEELIDEGLRIIAFMDRFEYINFNIDTLTDYFGSADVIIIDKN